MMKADVSTTFGLGILFDTSLLQSLNFFHGCGQEPPDPAAGYLFPFNLVGKLPNPSSRKSHWIVGLVALGKVLLFTSGALSQSGCQDKY